MSTSSSDRNLLFGILALQVNFISRDALVKGMNAWVLEKHRPLGEILVEQGALLPERRDILEAMVREHLKVHDNDPQKSLASINSVASVRKDLEQIADPDVQTNVGHVAADSWMTQAPAALPSASTARYKRLRPHAHGGLGEVFVALDEELKREVALKEIQERFADHNNARARFLREAEVTGNLEHPGVVPVYGLGSYPDGRPFYAMRFIRGESMQEAIRRFHKADEDPRRDPGERSLALRELLGRFVTVCNTLAYAHNRGVIHRDLKPANVMLGEYGETLVVDWGLAKLLDQPQSEETTAERPLQRGSASASAPTKMGQVVGTPAFMPPEQAAGQLDRVGVTSDVFELGATLYCLLTGQAPYSGPDVLVQARRGEVMPARQRKRSVPAALEAICAKAMARNPEVRYATAQSLAEEVQRWLADEPVEAYREPLMVKVGRWMRKNRVLAAAVAAAVVVALVLGSGGAVWVQQHKEQDRRERIAQQRRAGEQADAGLKQAAELRDGYRFNDARAMLEQVRGWASQAADRELSDRLKQAKADLELAHDLDNVRQKAATLVEGKWDPRRVRAEFPALLGKYGLDVLEGDPNKLAETIRASAVRDDIIAALDDWARWETDPQRKQRLVQLSDSADKPDKWRQAVRRAVALRDVRRLRQLVCGTGEGKPTPGVVLLLATAFGWENEETTALLRRMQLERPRDFWVSFALGIRHHEQQKYQEAAECFLVAVALRPDSCGAHRNLGVALHNKGKLDEAIACFKRAIDIDPKAAEFHFNLGNALKDKGQVDEAIACHLKAIKLDPKFAPAHNNLGNALHTKGKMEEAIACYKRAIALDPEYATAHYNLGLALKNKGRVDEAIGCYRKAIDIDPKLAQAHVNLGVALYNKGKLDEAIACYTRCINIDTKDRSTDNFPV